MERRIAGRDVASEGLRPGAAVAGEGPHRCGQDRGPLQAGLDLPPDRVARWGRAHVRPGGAGAGVRDERASGGRGLCDRNLAPVPAPAPTRRRPLARELAEIAMVQQAPARVLVNAGLLGLARQDYEAGMSSFEGAMGQLQAVHSGEDSAAPRYRDEEEMAATLGAGTRRRRWADPNLALPSTIWLSVPCTIAATLTPST